MIRVVLTDLMGVRGGLNPFFEFFGQSDSPAEYSFVL